MRASGFSPSAMNRFLVRLGPFSGGANIPEYLLTHPHITNRLSATSQDIPNPQPDEHYWTLYASTAGLVLPEEEAVQRAQGIPDPYRRLALGLAETRKGRHEEALRHLNGLDLPLAYAYKGLNLAMAGKKDEAYPYLKKYGNSARTRIVLAEIMEERGNSTRRFLSWRPIRNRTSRWTTSWVCSTKNHRSRPCRTYRLPDISSRPASTRRAYTISTRR